MTWNFRFITLEGLYTTSNDTLTKLMHSVVGLGKMGSKDCGTGCTIL